MAYIDWWNRTGPITMGERFGLNEISTARKTLSPTNSHTAGLSESFPGTFTSYQDAVYDGFQGTREEWLQQQSIPQIDRPLTGAAGGRVDMKPGGLVEPGVTHYATESFSYPEMAKKLGMKLSTLYGLNKNRTDIVKKLEKYFTIKTKTGPKASGDPVTFTLKKGFKLDNAIKDVQALMGRTPVHATPEMNLFVSQEVSKANAGEKFVTGDEILEKVHKKFKTELKSQIGTYPVLENLDTRAEKADQVLRNMLMEEKPLNGFWQDVAAERTGMNRLYFRRMLEQKQYNKKFPFAQNVPTYEVLRNQGADFISGRGNQGIPKTRGAYDFIKKLSFSDQLAKALEIQKGLPVLNQVGSRANTPKNKTMQFAFRNWAQNKGEGDIKLFDKKGDKITFEYGKVYNAQDLSFKYKGNMFSLRDRSYKVNNISDPTVLKTYFPVVEKITNEMNNFGQKKIANPFKKPFVMDKVTYKQGDKIMAKDLVKKIQVDGYGYKPSYGTLAVLHGSKGVKGEPFTNLIMNTSDINLAETSLYNSLEGNNISRKDYNKTIKDLRAMFTGTTGPQYQQSIIDRLGTQVKEIEKYTGKGKPLEIEKLLQIIKNLPSKEIEKIGEVIGCGRKKAKAEGGRIGFGVGSGSMLACIDAKFEKDPKSFLKRTAGIASAGLDKLWKYAAPYWFPSVIAATGRLEAFKDPTKPEMWWDIMLASDAVKRWGLDKVTLSQLKNASWLKKADIIGKLLLKFPGDKILTQAAKVAKPLIVATETLSAVKGIKTELDLVKEYALKNNIPYEDAKLAYYASAAALEPRWEGDKSFKSWASSKLIGGSTVYATAWQKRNDPEFQQIGKNVFQYIKENKPEPVEEEVTEKVEIPSGLDWALNVEAQMKKKEPQEHAALDSFAMGGIASLIK